MLLSRSRPEGEKNQRNFIVRQVEKFQIPVKTSQNTFYQQFQNVDPETSINEKEKKSLLQCTWLLSPGNNQGRRLPYFFGLLPSKDP